VNGFAKQQLDIGAKQPIHQLKTCDKCGQTKPPEGGIQMSPSKWHCVTCWTKRATVRNLR